MLAHLTCSTFSLIKKSLNENSKDLHEADEDKKKTRESHYFLQFPLSCCYEYKSSFPFQIYSTRKDFALQLLMVTAGENEWRAVTSENWWRF